MTKAYLAGFIAGASGKTWADCPFKNEDRYSQALALADWREGCDDGQHIARGDVEVGIEEAGK